MIEILQIADNESYIIFDETYMKRNKREIRQSIASFSKQLAVGASGSCLGDAVNETAADSGETEGRSEENLS